MPDDPFSQVVYVWTMFATQARRAFRYKVLGVQGAPGVGGGNGGVAAAAGPAEDAGVASQTKGGSGMSADDREARRLAVEAAARELIETSLPAAMTDRTSAAYAALRAAVRRLDAPRWEIVPGSIDHEAVWCLRWASDTSLNMWTKSFEQAKRAAALLNDAEGKP